MKSSTMCSSSPSSSPRNARTSFGLQVDLAEQHRLAVAAVEVGAQVAQELVRVVERALDQERHGVDAEARQPLREPEAHHLRELVAHLRVGEVEVGLVGVELVQVVLPGLARPTPSWSPPGRGRRRRPASPSGFSSRQT